MKTVLITGAAGFIGSHLCRHLMNEGFFVIGIDNFITGNPKNLVESNRFQFIKGDAQNIFGFDLDRNPDYIFHLASPASPKDYQAHAIETMLSNSMATMNLLDFASHFPKIRILLASTSEVYGSPQVHPQREDYWGHVNSYGPRCMYDESKRFQEAAAWVWQQNKKTDVRIARIFNTYGPNIKANDGRVIPQFINQALTNQPITIHGDGEQTRSFCYVSDTVAGLVALMFSEYAHKPVNIGNPDEVTMRELATEIITLTKSKSKLIFLERPGDDPENRCPDIRLAKNLLNWKPAVSRAIGLQRTIRFFKQQLNSIPA